MSVKYLRNQYDRLMQTRDILPLFGLKAGSPIPLDMTAKCEINGINVKIILPPKAGRRKHRVIATCPDCGNNIPAGRLSQHVGKKTCK